MRQLIDNMKLHKETPLVMSLYLLGFFLLGFIGHCVILGLNDTAISWIPVGTLMGILGIIAFLIIRFLSYHPDFMLALSLGMTRREFMITYALEQLVWTWLAYTCLVLTASLERVLYPMMFPETFEAFTILPYLTDWRIIVPSVLTLVLLPMFFGSLYSRFGKKFGALLYIIWMAACFLGPSVITRFDASDDPTHVGNMLSWITNIPMIGWVIAGVIAAVTMIVVIIHLGMKQMVR